MSDFKEMTEQLLKVCPECFGIAEEELSFVTENIANAHLNDYREINISDNTVLTIGKFGIENNRLKADNAPLFICFTVLYQKKNGKWMAEHLHLSVEGEAFYGRHANSQKLVKQVEKIKKLAERDGLTGLLNFRSFCERFDSAKKDGAWLFIIDVDNFKSINDTYGHLAGNKALKLLAAIMRDSVCGGDLLCRMGGDEFLILFCRPLTADEAANTARRLIENVGQIGGEAPISGISIGITQTADGQSLHSAIKKADKALYISKTSGKNTFTAV